MRAENLVSPYITDILKILFIQIMLTLYTGSSVKVLVQVKYILIRIFIKSAINLCKPHVKIHY